MTNCKSLLGAVALAMAASVAANSAARADDPPKFGYTLTITGSSDYMFRGISFTNNKPEFNPYLELTYGIGYVGFWASNIGDGANPNTATLGPWEVDYYAGIRPVVGPVNFDIGVLYYTYGARPAGLSIGDVSYAEFKVAASTSPITNLTIGVTGYATPDQGFAVPQTETVEGSVSYALPQMGIFAPTLSGIVGYTTSETSKNYPTGGFLGLEDYTYWNAGIKLTVDKFFMDFRYWDTSINNSTEDDLADSRFVFAAGVTLP